jgi:hypothetical protein
MTGWSFRRIDEGLEGHPRSVHGQDPRPSGAAQTVRAAAGERAAFADGYFRSGGRVQDANTALQDHVTLDLRLRSFPTERATGCEFAEDDAVLRLAVQLGGDELATLDRPNGGLVARRAGLSLDGHDQCTQQIELLGIGKPPLVSSGIRFPNENAHFDPEHVGDAARDLETRNSLVGLDLTDVGGSHLHLPCERRLRQAPQIPVESDVLPDSSHSDPPRSTRKNGTPVGGAD